MSDSNNIKSGSLYITDLDKNIGEKELIDYFKSSYEISSVKVCRDFSSGESLGFGYVNFGNYEQAQLALGTENYKKLNGKEFRLMWQIKDSKLVAKFNIIVKNLPKDMTSKELADHFKDAGEVFSSKIPVNSKQNSEGFGFVCFYDEAPVTKAIELHHNKEYKGKTLTVERYDKKSNENKETPFNNLYVKNFPKEYNMDQIEAMFSKFGKVLSVKVELDANNESKGFGFVCFENSDDAKNAIDALHNTKLDNGNELYVSKFEKKSERTRKLKLEMTKGVTQDANSKKNLYVKFINEGVSEEMLRKEFEAFGKVTSVKIQVENVTKGEKEYMVHRGYGFVSFDKPEDALKALENMNGKVLQGKPLFVTYLMNKEQRKHVLNNQVKTNHQQQRFGMGHMGGMPPMMQGMQPGMQPGMQLNFQQQQQQRGMPQMMQGMPHQMGQKPMNGKPMANMPMGGQPMRMGGQPMMQGMQPGMQHGMVKPMPSNNGMQMMPGVRNPQQIHGGQGMHQQQQQQPQQQPQQKLADQTNQMKDDWEAKRASFSLDYFNGLKSTQDKCQYLGEIFWPYVAAKDPELKRKITGFMIWNFDHKELINAIKDDTLLNEIFEKSKKTVQNTSK